MTTRQIELRGVAVHNLKEVDLDLPHGKLIVLCGPSGSGKSSLALDTLYAEGQRRYIECFSPHARQFLGQIERPAAARIDGVPPAVAVRHDVSVRSSRATVGTATEIVEYLRLLLASIGHVVCPSCGRTIVRERPQSVVEQLSQLPAGSRIVVAFAPVSDAEPAEAIEQPLLAKASGLSAETIAQLKKAGFVRAFVGGQMRAIDELDGDSLHGGAADVFVVVDRLVIGGAEQRLRESIETAFAQGLGACHIFVETSASSASSAVQFEHRIFCEALRCPVCRIDFPEPDPKRLSFDSPLGACPTCEGFGNVMDLDMDLIVPDPAKSIRDGAIAPWNTKSYAHELEELLALAPQHDVRVDVPFSELTARERELVQDGVPERKFGGLVGFFNWLERRKYKMHVRVFLNRWRRYRTCPACEGRRLRPEALATKLGGRNIAELSAMTADTSAEFFASLDLPHWELAAGRTMLDQVRARVGFLREIGLGYLSLDRALRTLSGGEMQRVSLATALGSSLVNMLYVLDEPSIGLHPHDVERLVGVIGRLRDRGNTVVVVEHEPALIRSADQVVEIGPGAGERGGQVLFQGTPTEMEATEGSLTGDYLAGRRGQLGEPRRRPTNRGSIRLRGARGNNLKNINVEFPLGVLCVVTGVSGSGKSTLVEDTLYPSLLRRLRRGGAGAAEYDDVYGDGQIEDVVLVDQAPVGRSPRSNPVTYVKAFDEIRAVFSEVADARTRGYTASHFSFNVEGGRCPKCEGDGYRRIDMQFLPDVLMRCDECHGRRYRREILAVKHRGKSIADVLDMTVREAFLFFRGESKTQRRLKQLIDVGLDYLRLGQPANTLSGGESQRLKLAAYMTPSKRGRTLMLLDEPTTGLHFSDVAQLLDCFTALLDMGHSLVVVEHNLQVLAAADYVIDLGPGAADQGGHVVASGTPEDVAQSPTSLTGRYLAEALSSVAE